MALDDASTIWGLGHDGPTYPKNRGRSHARIYAYWRKLPAWFTLCPRGQALVVAVFQAYHPDYPNAFELSDRIAARVLGCAENTARPIVKAIMERGWVVQERRGGFRGPVSTRGRVVSLSAFPTDCRRAEPHRFEQWKPSKPISNGANSAVYIKPVTFERLKD